MKINSKQSGVSVYKIGRNTSIDRFLNSIRQYKPLTFEEENYYVTKYKVDGDISARDMLVNCNQRFVYSAAKRFSSNADTIMELVNEGNIGLMEAIERFDFSVGCRLLTYAQSYIRRSMVFYFCNNRLIRRPTDYKIGSILSTERNIFYNENERNPTVEELREIMANKYGIDVRNDEDLYINDICHIDGKMAEDDDEYTFGRTDDYNNATASYNGYEETIDGDYLKATVMSALSKLDDRTREIVKMLYGIGYDREYTTSEIAEVYGLTKTRVNQIRKEATRKLEYFLTA